MKYIIYKLSFPNGVHFGNKSLEDSEFTFHADTLFSALCQEAKKDSLDSLEKLVEKAKNGDIVLSDAFPFIDNEFYIPKPIIRIESEEKGDSKTKKAFKRLTYITMSGLVEYLNGQCDAQEEVKKIGKLGQASSRVLTDQRREETLPYRVGVYNFNVDEYDCGLYVILGYDNDDDYFMLSNLFEGLSYSGIGGKRSSGLGRFDIRTSKIPPEIEKRLNNDGSRYMSLSVALPNDDEFENALANSSYKLIKRSGFVASADYADEYMRKRDLFVFDAGSCFTFKFDGVVADVSEYGRHPVYRYAKPMFLEVSIWKTI